MAFIVTAILMRIVISVTVWALVVKRGQEVAQFVGRHARREILKMALQSVLVSVMMDVIQITTYPQKSVATI